jgi:phosphate starvation-inducible PhoH-like protein
MKMFLTRLGHGGKMVITGDTSQIDLPVGQTSGLIDAVRRLHRVPGIAFTTLDKSDIVRHSLVQRIVEAYGEESSTDHQTPARSKKAASRGTSSI